MNGRDIFTGHLARRIATVGVLGSPDRPLRVAVVGSGPAAFYVVERFFKQKDVTVEIDMFERLPVPFGLVRFGVAPDHPKIKSVTRVYERLASDERFRFFGNVHVGTHVSLSDLMRHYHQICYATGAQTDRPLGIPGDDLEGSHSATEFVAWYNGHPDFRESSFDLSARRVAIIGVGNVAVDVARILCRTEAELQATDIADYALAALAESQVEEVWMLGRRGPVQAAFTNTELRELGELDGADIVVRHEDMMLDPLSANALEASDDRALAKRMEILEQFAGRDPIGKRARLAIRFLVSPVEILGQGGRVAGIRLVRNRLEERDGGALKPVATDEFEDLPVDLVFRSIGYRGVPLDGLPFDEWSGTIPNDEGRVLNDGNPVPGVYVAGWIKRGPTGVIGTNKPDSAETVNRMLEDVASGTVLDPKASGRDDVAETVRAAQPDFISYDDWHKIDALETKAGEETGRPRVKFTDVEDVLAALRG